MKYLPFLFGIIQCQNIPEIETFKFKKPKVKKFKEKINNFQASKLKCE